MSLADGAPKQLGRYRVVKELGRGAMGVVYKAEDPSLGRMVAIKTILLAADPDGGDGNDDNQARFFQEAKAAGGLNHPNIITIYDLGMQGELAYMAMELLGGDELRTIMSSDRIALSAALEIAAQVADGLAAAHERGVVHRDIKPSNIMLLRGQHVKIMDFGIARLQVSNVKTQTGTRLGSPKYMSPEQIVGRDVDHRSDIYSLGVVLYEMVAGAAPFSAPDVTQLMYQIGSVTSRPPSVFNPAVPPMLDLIVAKALAKDSADRYQHAWEMAADLRTCRAALPVAPVVSDMGGDTVPTTTAKASVPGAARALKIDSVAAAPNLRQRAAEATGAAQLGLSISREYDAVPTLQRLKFAAAAKSHATTLRNYPAADTTVLRRAISALRKNPGMWILGASFFAAFVVAVAIALV